MEAGTCGVDEPPVEGVFIPPLLLLALLLLLLLPLLLPLSCLLEMPVVLLTMDLNCLHGVFGCFVLELELRLPLLLLPLPLPLPPS